MSLRENGREAKLEAERRCGLTQQRRHNHDQYKNKDRRILNPRADAFIKALAGRKLALVRPAPPD